MSVSAIGGISAGNFGGHGMPPSASVAGSVGTGGAAGESSPVAPVGGSGGKGEGDKGGAVNISIVNTNMSTQDMVSLQNSSNSCSKVSPVANPYEVGGQQQGLDLKKLLEMMIMIQMLQMMQKMMGEQGIGM